MADTDITVTETGAVNVTPTTPLAFALDIVTNYSSTFSNAGTLSVSGNVIGPVSALGLFGNLEEQGRLLNSGTIEIDVVNASPLDSAGIFTIGNSAGTIRNSGTIDVNSEFTVSMGNSLGILLFGDLTQTGAILNDGTITVAVEADNATTEATGITVTNDVTEKASVINSGTITSTARTVSGGEADAAGIAVDDDLNGTLTNSGKITAVASSRDGDAFATGFYIGDDLEGTSVNSGTLAIEATSSTAESSATGVDVDDDLHGSFTNSGTILLSAEAATFAAVSGVRVDEILSGRISNTGTLSMKADADDVFALAIGVFVEDMEGGEMRNSGTINVSANSLNGRAQAGGLVVDGEMDAASRIRNTGAVTVSGVSGSKTQDVFITGIDVVDDMRGTLANSGTIRVSATGGRRADAFGILIRDFNGIITDLGTIIVSADDDAYAVFLDGGTGTMNVDTEDNVAGLMRVDAHNINLDAKGGSNIFRFEDANPDAGTFTKIVSDPGSAWFVSDEGGDRPIYATVDSSDLNINGNVVADLGKVLDGLTAALPAYTPSAQASRDANQRTFLSAEQPFIDQFRPFISAQTRAITYDQTDQLEETDYTLFNAAVGMAGTLGNGMTLSFGIGTLSAEGQTGRNDFDIGGFYAGVVLGTRFGALDLNAGLGFGQLETEKSRAITSGGTAKAQFDSTFLTAHLGATRSFEVTGGAKLTAFGSLRYTRQSDDGYTEGGSDADARVSDRVTDVTETILALEFSHTLDFGGIATGRISAVSRNIFGDDETRVTVFEQSAGLASADVDFDGLRVGVGYEHSLAENAMLNLAAEYEMGDDGAGPNFTAGLVWTF